MKRGFNVLYFILIGLVTFPSCGRTQFENPQTTIKQEPVPDQDLRVVLVGPPASGKGTLSKILKKIIPLDHYSTGDLIRNEIKQKTEFGLLAQSVVQSGKILSDALFFPIFSKAFAQWISSTSGFILDGFPRTVPQAEYLQTLFAQFHQKLDLVIVLKTSEEEILERMTHRRTCSHCGRSYHLTRFPPKIPHQCDDDQKPLMQRDDDTYERIQIRLAEYREKTVPLVDFYKSQGTPVLILDSTHLDKLSHQVLARRIAALTKPKL